jgi:rubrerythrin
MSDHISLDLVDTDGAIREAEEAVAGDSRADFFRKAALTGGAALGGGVLLSGFPTSALAATKKSKKNDVAILNFALTLEYLESAFYTEALAKTGLTGDNLTTTQIVSNHENAHVAYLKKALGKSAVKKPKFDFGVTTANQTNFLKTAVQLEDTGVKAYSGQATNILEAKVVKAAVSILTVEARHASRFRSLNGANFAPSKFDHPATAAAVLKAVKKTKFIKS